MVRSIAGAAATKTYRCPGCNQAVTPGTPHVVVWPDVPMLSSATGLDERRHWHTSCWQRRP
ncbi:MAG: ATP/GTP-binding protein [uncultured Propionibacteriaceae bacterium]|uniref:ATP/GTP-binding protein n=1 Tax=uncultured Propionibacteriaceae bacterium TaxID=257457 RepID=A0A6J4NQV7_9ACTN|nr:MAG: ATP/GTP-binding protein [uncultured Propionibacteriaceae bacterium]